MDGWLAEVPCLHQCTLNPSLPTQTSRPRKNFTPPGIGENSPLVRALVCRGLERTGIVIDREANEEMVGGRQGFISTPASRVKVLVIPTDEELSIAQQTLDVVYEGEP
jgi:acetate kinase